jgi:hypothetical protein
MLADARTGNNGRHALVGLVRQSVFGCLAGYEDVNDADACAAIRRCAGSSMIDRRKVRRSRQARWAASRQLHGVASDVRSAAGHGGARIGGDDDGAARPRAITSPSGAATRDSHAPDRQPQRCHPVVHRSDERTRVQDPRITSLSYKPGQFGADPGGSDLGDTEPDELGEDDREKDSMQEGR